MQRRLACRCCRKGGEQALVFSAAFSAGTVEYVWDTGAIVGLVDSADNHASAVQRALLQHPRALRAGIIPSFALLLRAEKALVRLYMQVGM